MSTHKRVEKRYDDIIKSQNDDRLYRGLLLANKMKVLLISDPITDKSAVAMDVNVGTMCDPDDLPGLAHFCEHMLFLGTEKYPQQNDYATYLSQNGGRSNATTQLDHTTYYFDVTPEKLEGALDRFAQFFLAPLFTETLTELELNAINSEHEKNLTNDFWRINQLEKSSACPDHPFSKFGTGNRETLDIIPKQKGINVRDRLLEFYEKYYSANIMSLCILGKESLDELENMVVDLFCEVRNKEVEIPVWSEHPFKDEHFGTIWYIVPIKDERNLNIWFSIPDLRQHYKSSPAFYVYELLGHEGTGSLISILKTRNWSCYLLSHLRTSARGIMFFGILVDLTEEGIKHVEDIVQLTFQYINMLKLNGPIEWIYNEYRDIANINFCFQEKQLPMNYVSNTVHKLQKYPMIDVLCAAHVFKEWRPDLIVEVMKYLTPDNVRIHVAAKTYENIANETESWYGTKYKKEKVSKETMDTWNNAGYNSNFKLPSKNKFIPTKFDIKPETNIETFPIILKDTSYIRLWYKKDNEFFVPKAWMIFDFVSPIAYMDPITCNLSHMFILLFRDSLYVYDAYLAGLKWDLIDYENGLRLTIDGYDNKQRILLEKIINQMMNLKVDPKIFEILKEMYISILKNFAAHQPHQHALIYLAFLLKEHDWLNDELLDSTAYLTVERLQWFISQLFSKVHVECLIYGNVTRVEAIDIVKLIESKLINNVPPPIPLLQKQLVLNREIKLEDESTESNMLLRLLMQIISEPCYNILRTTEQLGYIVLRDIYKTRGGAQGLRILVQSNKHPQYVEKRINSFMDSMLDYITTMPEEQFEKHRNTLVTLFLEKPKMKTRCTFYWNEILNQQYNFDRVNIEVSYLKTITQQQLLNFYKENVHSKTQPKLSVHVISAVTSVKNNPIDNTKKVANLSFDEEVKKIDNILSFKNSQTLYPLLKPFNEYPRKGIRHSKL